MLATLLVSLFGTYFGAYAIFAHGIFHTQAYDLGTFDQGIWLAGHGRNWFVTVRGLSLFGDHVRVLSLLLAPLYWLVDDVRALLVLHAAVIAAGGWFVFRLARRELPGQPWAWLVLSAGWLLHPAVQNLALDYAHPDAFASTFLLASVDSLRGGRRGAFWCFAALAMSCKEDVPLAFVAMGLSMLATQRTRRLGATLALAAGASFVLCVGVILPVANGVGFFRFERRGIYSGLHDHWGEPTWWAALIADGDSVSYLLRLVGPFLLLPVLAPVSLVPALPALVANLASDAVYQRSFEFHYQTSVLPFVFLATIDALSRIGYWLALVAGVPGTAGSVSSWPAVANRALRASAPIALLGAAVWANLAWSRVPIDELDRIRSEWPDAQQQRPFARLQRIVGRIPHDAVVAADYTIVPHLTHRPRVYMLPNPFVADEWGIHGEHLDVADDVQYIVVRDIVADDRVRAVVTRLVKTGIFEELESDSGTTLYRRATLRSAADHAGCGDWDGDGHLMPTDLRSVAGAIAAGRPCPPSICDADGSGSVDARDVDRLRERLADPAVRLECPPSL